MRKYFVIIVLSIFLLSLSSNVYAEVPSDVLQAAQGSLTNFYPSLKLDSEHFNLTPDDQKGAFNLAEGYPYYKVSATALKDFQSGKKINLSQLYVPSGGYIIPIKTANKQVAIAQVEYFEGKWQVVQISSDESLESDLIFAKGKIKESLSLDIKPADTKLIYDQAFGMKALQVQGSNGEFVMPLGDNDSLSLRKTSAAPRSFIQTMTSVILYSFP